MPDRAISRGRPNRDGQAVRPTMLVQHRQVRAFRLERWLSAHAPIRRTARAVPAGLRSEEHTSELQSLMRISYAVFCLKKKKTRRKTLQIIQRRKRRQKHRRT